MTTCPSWCTVGSHDPRSVNHVRSLSVRTIDAGLLHVGLYAPTGEPSASTNVVLADEDLSLDQAALLGALLLDLAARGVQP
jgi:hypothetical protein